MFKHFKYMELTRHHIIKKTKKMIEDNAERGQGSFDQISEVVFSSVLSLYISYLTETYFAQQTDNILGWLAKLGIPSKIEALLLFLVGVVLFVLMFLIIMRIYRFSSIKWRNHTGVVALQSELKHYKSVLVKKIVGDLVKLYSESDIKEKNNEYQQMISQKPEITEEDFLYIEQIINNSMSKKLQIVRDDKKNIKIVLENRDFLGVERDDLPLSKGEQNFLSLTFEFLKAKNSNKPIVVLDDPISSFDSIYKNKIAYAIIKILQNKKRIILTHNVDLLRLLDGQYKKCFKLFLFNNTDNEENGFISLNFNEQDMLINLEKLLNTFREDVFDYIKEPELYLISMIVSSWSSL